MESTAWAEKKSKCLERLVAISALALRSAESFDFDAIDARLETRASLLHELEDLDRKASLADLLASFPRLSEWSAVIEKIQSIDTQIAEKIRSEKRNSSQAFTKLREERQHTFAEHAQDAKGIRLEVRG